MRRSWLLSFLFTVGPCLWLPACGDDDFGTERPPHDAAVPGADQATPDLNNADTAISAPVDATAPPDSADAAAIDGAPVPDLTVSVDAGSDGALING